jgi:large subunit ribosomal protein L3
VNWDAIKSSSEKKLKGFIGYKAGMATAYVKDNTEHSMTSGKRITIPVTIVECPPMKILSVRSYNNGKVLKEILNESLEKELKRKLKLPKKKKNKINELSTEGIEDIRIVVYSLVKKTGLKKTPDLIELGLTGTLEEKLSFVKENLNKEISFSEFFEKGELVDVRGLTTGRGFQGPVKRFGIKLKASKSEKGTRRPGSLGPWHPARVIFRVPMAGQTGFFTRVVYNNKIVDLGKAENNFKNIKNYGDIKTEYLILRGSIQGPSKRQIVLTKSLRPTKKQLKKDYEFIELR